MVFGLKMEICFCTHNSSLERATKLKLAPFCCCWDALSDVYMIVFYSCSAVSSVLIPTTVPLVRTGTAVLQSLLFKCLPLPPSPLPPPPSPLPPHSSPPHSSTSDCEAIKTWLIKCQNDSETANYIKANTKDVSHHPPTCTPLTPPSFPSVPSAILPLRRTVAAITW